MTPEIAAVLGRVCMVAIGIVFALAVIPKLRRPEAFAEVVANYELVPSRSTRPASLVVILTELVVAVSMISGFGTFFGLPLAGATLGVFIVVVVITLRRGRSVSCGCFGSSSEPTSVATVARLVILLGVVFASAILTAVSRPGSNSPIPNTADGAILQQLWILLAGGAVVLIGLLGSSARDLFEHRAPPREQAGNRALAQAD